MAGRPVPGRGTSAIGRIPGHAAFWGALILSLASWAQSPPAFDVARHREKAQAGDARSQALYGSALLDGDGVAKNEAEGVKWLKLSAAKGDTRGLTILGFAYLDGQGVPKNTAEALRLLLQASEKGYALAQGEVAQLLYSGAEVPRNEAEAVRWAKRAAEQNDAGGQFILASAYLQGRGGLAQDVVKGEELLRKAAGNGHAGARKILEDAERKRAAGKAGGAGASPPRQPSGRESK
jgi:TPR repeat protein